MAPVKEGEELFAAVRSFSNKMVDALVMTSLVTETGGLGATAGLLRRTI